MLQSMGVTMRWTQLSTRTTTTNGHLPSPSTRIKSCAAAAADLQQHLKGVQGGKQKEKGMTEDEMPGWNHQLDEREFEQAPGVGDGQRSLACCSPWGCKESDMTETLN